MTEPAALLETERTVLRPWRMDEVDRLFDIHRREEVARWIGGRVMPDRAEAVEIEIGWHLHPDSWGRGLATEAALALRDHGFAVGLTEIWAVTDLDNAASINVCRKLSMRELGVTNRWYHKPLRMFWLGVDPGQRPSIAPDQPAPPGPQPASPASHLTRVAPGRPQPA